MKFHETSLPDVLLIKPAIFSDNRGQFFESFNANSWQEQGFTNQFVQDNQSFSRKGVLRGLHFQSAPFAQGKLVRVIKGRVLDIALDLRPESPSFGQYELFELDEEGGNMVYIPEGFAHGFLALEDSIFHYKCTAPYCKAAEGGIRWDDPSLNIPWGVVDPLVSSKDQILPTFQEYIKKVQTPQLV